MIHDHSSGRSEIGLFERARVFRDERIDDPIEGHAGELGTGSVANGVRIGLELLITHHERVRGLGEL